jgi:hypothetical protein
MGKKFTRPLPQQNKLGMVVHACHPSCGGKLKIGESRFRLGRVGGVAQWFHLLSKYKP